MLRVVDHLRRQDVVTVRSRTGMPHEVEHVTARAVVVRLTHDRVRDTDLLLMREALVEREKAQEGKELDAEGVMLTLGSVQALGLGVVSEYVRRMFHEVKGRPSYIVREGPAAAPRVEVLPDTRRAA